MKNTNNEFTMTCRIKEAKARVEKIAKSGISFEDYLYAVNNDEKITSLVPGKTLNIIIKKYSYLPN